MRIVTILNEATGIKIGDRIERADSSWTRLVGLLGRKSLQAGGGVWLSPSSGVHTFGMRFPIDVVGLDSDMRVVRLWPNVKPQRVTSISLNVQSVLELAAGEIASRSLRLGQTLSIRSDQNA